MIKASALRVALAIGLLVAGVVGSSLLMVYVSIGVCAVAALLLAVGVLSHWSEIFGRSESRPASTQGVWSEPQMQVNVAVASAPAAPAAQAPAAQAPVARAAGGRSSGRRSHDHPVEVIQPVAAEPVMRRGDDLWERVDEELGSTGKRDTGALSWPAIQVPVLRDAPAPPESAGSAAEAGPRDEPRAGASAWMWGSGSGWQPPQTSDPAWPPPAAAFAQPKADQEAGVPEAEPASEAEPVSEPASGAEAAPETEAAPDTEAAPGTAPGSDAAPVPDTAPAAGDAATADPGVIADAEDREAAGPAPESTPGEPAAGEVPAEATAEAAAEDGPQWIIAAPHREPPAGDAAGRAATAGQSPDEPAAGEPAAGEPAAGEPASGGPAVQEPAPQEPAAGAPAVQESAPEESAPQEPAAEEPAAGEPAAEASEAGEPAAEGAAAAAAPGRVEVTVVPGVARYHRSGCILIRFLGAGDLEIMSRQEAEDATFMACRACQPDQLES